MLTLKAINVNIADRWNRTPIHYACMRGSTMSTLFLIQKGADLDIIDEYQNTPLSTALFYK